MSQDVCPKCGARLCTVSCTEAPYDGFDCGSHRFLSGQFFQSDGCRNRQLKAENARLNHLIEIGFNGSPPPVPIKNLVERLAKLTEENARLKRGDFTPEEFQALCHHRDEKPGCEFMDFTNGCHEYQKKLFGQSERDYYEAMKEGVSVRIADLESTLAAERKRVNAKVQECTAAINRKKQTIESTQKELGDCDLSRTLGMQRLGLEQAADIFRRVFADTKEINQ